MLSTLTDCFRTPSDLNDSSNGCPAYWWARMSLLRNSVENAPELLGVPQRFASKGVRSGLRMWW